MELSFDNFKERANDKNLSKWEKIGFPDSYRKGLEQLIFNDICSKVNIKDAESVLDIGCGCSELVEQIIAYAKTNEQKLFLVDSDEMLSNIDLSLNYNNIHLVPGKFPDSELLKVLETNIYDVIIVYSVIQYVFINQSIFHFIHECIKLLKPGGRLLIGDIPNYQVRERFLKSEEGLNFLSKASKVNNTIDLHHDNIERIDDSVIMSLLFRFRNFGCETYLLPQSKNLPFSNRREDILIIKR
jgi:2-polyprenyl-3-methyl-5-hydroxy-6-metoxy-1,4-benzoquinol methylase